MTRTLFPPLLMAAMAAGSLGAQDVPARAGAEHPGREGRWGVGLQLTWPTVGLSGMMDMSEDASLQGIIGTAGYGLAIAARGIYRLPPQEHFRPFVYGELGLWSAYRDWGAVPNLGGGAGIELDIRQFLPDAPPVYASFEAGINIGFYSDPELGSGSHARFQIGPAVHYRF